MFGRDLIAVQLHRLATINPHQEPAATAQEGGVGYAEQRNTGLLVLHAQHHAALEVRQEWAEQRGLRAARCGDDAHAGIVGIAVRGQQREP